MLRKQAKGSCVLLQPEVSPGEKYVRHRRQVSGAGSGVFASPESLCWPHKGQFWGQGKFRAVVIWGRMSPRQEAAVVAPSGVLCPIYLPVVPLA